MPSLDMSDGLLDPAFQDWFRVIRQIQTVSNKGRAINKPLIFPRVMGVVTAASPNDLERLGDYQYQGSAISIVTKFKLQGIAKGVVAGGINSAGQPQPQYSPDKIKWSGSVYLAITVEDYSRYGSGFMQCIAVSTDYIDDEPDEAMIVSSLNFSDPANSGLVPILQPWRNY